MDDPIVRIEDIRAALPGQTCSLGMRRWAITNEIDFRAFLRDGVPLSRLQRREDYFVSKVAEYMRSKA